MHTGAYHDELLHCSLWYAGAGSEAHVYEDGPYLVAERQLTMEPPVDEEEEFEMPGPTTVKVFTLPQNKKVVAKIEKAG